MHVCVCGGGGGEGEGAYQVIYTELCCRNLQKNSRFLRNNSNYLPSLFGVCMHCCQPCIKREIIVNAYVLWRKQTQPIKPNFKKSNTKANNNNNITSNLYSAIHY